VGIDGRIIIKRILWKYVEKMWTGYMWLRIVTDDGLL
jgi:hypothetical protein